MEIIITKGDITEIACDAIVNAANNSLRGGGGVDGAIHHKAGPMLLEECLTLNGCATGQAKVTKGYQLPAQYIIHTVGPIYKDGLHQEGELLASCYRESLKLASSLNCQHIAFPSISTGVYGYPISKAVVIALKTIVDYMKEHDEIKKVEVVCFDDYTYQTYLKEKEKISVL